MREILFREIICGFLSPDWRRLTRFFCSPDGKTARARKSKNFTLNTSDCAPERRRNCEHLSCVEHDFGEKRTREFLEATREVADEFEELRQTNGYEYAEEKLIQMIAGKQENGRT